MRPRSGSVVERSRSVGYCSGVEPRNSVLLSDPEGLICAFLLAPTVPIGSESLEDLGPGKPAWLHFNWADARARNWLKEQANVPGLVLESLLEVDPHAHLQLLPEGFVAILRDVNHEFASSELEFGTLGIYLERWRVISGRRQPLQTLDTMRRELLDGVQLESPMGWFEHLVERLAETYDGVVTKITAKLETAEDEILAGRFRDQGAELRRMRWELARLRRHALSNRSTLLRLPGHLPHFCGPERRQSLSQAIDGFASVAQDLELAEERARLLQEEISARLGEDLNRNLYLLSIVTTAMLPVTLITGIFGMNVGGLPWLEDNHGFASVMFLMALALVVSLTVIFRTRPQ